MATLFAKLAERAQSLLPTLLHQGEIASAELPSLENRVHDFLRNETQNTYLGHLAAVIYNGHIEDPYQLSHEEAYGAIDKLGSARNEKEVADLMHRYASVAHAETGGGLKSIILIGGHRVFKHMKFPSDATYVTSGSVFDGIAKHDDISGFNTSDEECERFFWDLLGSFDVSRHPNPKDARERIQNVHTLSRIFARKLKDGHYTDAKGIETQLNLIFDRPIPEGMHAIVTNYPTAKDYKNMTNASMVVYSAHSHPQEKLDAVIRRTIAFRGIFAPIYEKDGSVSCDGIESDSFPITLANSHKINAKDPDFLVGKLVADLNHNPSEWGSIKLAGYRFAIGETMPPNYPVFREKIKALTGEDLAYVRDKGDPKGRVLLLHYKLDKAGLNPQSIDNVRKRMIMDKDAFNGFIKFGYDHTQDRMRYLLHPRSEHAHYRPATFERQMHTPPPRL